MTLTHHEQALLLLRFLQQRQRKAELEQTLVLAEAQGSPLVILPRQHIFSWKKKPKVDVQAVRRELSEIEKHPISLSSQACLEIAAQLLRDAKQSEDRSAQTGAELIEQALKLEALAEDYDAVISQSYDTREAEGQRVPFTGYVGYAPNVQIPYDLPRMRELGEAMKSSLKETQRLVHQLAWSREWDVQLLLKEEVEGFKDIQLNAARFHARARSDMETASRIRNALICFLPRFLETLLDAENQDENPC